MTIPIPETALPHISESRLFPSSDLCEQNCAGFVCIEFAQRPLCIETPCHDTGHLCHKAFRFSRCYMVGSDVWLSCILTNRLSNAPQYRDVLLLLGVAIFDVLCYNLDC